MKSKMEKVIWLTIFFLILLFSQAEAVLRADTDSVKVPVSVQVFELVKSWDPDIWFFTPAANPISALEGLADKDIACWGAEHFARVKDLYKALGIEDIGVNVIGDGAYAGAKPRLYITWSRYAPSLEGAVRVEFVNQNQPSQKSLPFEVRLARLADAKTSGYGDTPLTGLILEIENNEPNYSLIIDAPSVKLSTMDGKKLTSLLMFFVEILQGNVSAVSTEKTTLLGKEIFIGDTSYKALGSMDKMAVKMEEDGSANYIFREKSILQLGFIFAEDRRNINHLDFFDKAIDLSTTALNLAGEWEGISSWPGITFSMNFFVDENSFEMSDLTLVFECTQGEPKTKAEQKAGKKIRISKDSEFSFTSAQNESTVSGQFLSDELAKGTYKSKLTAKCGDKWIELTGEWTAKKKRGA